MSVKETLIKTKTVLRERGINRNGDYINDETGCLCIIGALYVATGAELVEGPVRFGIKFHTRDSEAFSEAHDFLYEVADGGVTTFNDNSESDDEIYDFLDKVIARAE
jgi:hypothetical protein